MNQKRTRTNLVALDHYEPLREWEGRMDKSLLMCPVKIELAEGPPDIDYATKCYIDSADRCFSYFRGEIEDKCLIIIKLRQGAFVRPATLELSALSTFYLYALSGSCRIVVGEPDFDGSLKGRRGYLDLAAYRGLLITKDNFNYFEIQVNQAKDPCYILFVESGKEESKIDMELIINPMNADELNDQFCNESAVSISNYVNDAVLNDLKAECAVDTADLECVYPMNVRIFHWLRPTRFQCEISKLLEMFENLEFIRNMSRLTSLDITGVIQPARLRILTPGSYQILHDNYAEPEGLDLFLCCSSADCPTHSLPEWTYINEEGEVVATFPFTLNTLHIAYRSKGCRRFIRHISLLSTFRISLFSVTYMVSS